MNSQLLLILLLGSSLALLLFALLGIRSFRKAAERRASRLSRVSAIPGSASRMPVPAELVVKPHDGYGKGGASPSVVGPRQDRPPFGLVLAGYDTDNRRLRVKISRDELSETLKGVSIGRDQDLVDKHVDCRHLSRRHARVAWREGRFTVECLKAKNQTTINGVVIDPFKPTPFDIQDQIEMGGVTFMVVKG